MKKGKLLPLIAEIAAEVERKEMSMYAVAKAAGVTATVAARVLAGQRPDPQLSTVEKLATAVGKRIVLVDGKGK